MPHNQVKRSLPYLAVAATSLTLSLGWGSAAGLHSVNTAHTLSSPDISAMVQPLSTQGLGLSSAAQRKQRLGSAFGGAVMEVEAQAQTFQPVTGTQSGFANPAFQRIWERTDRLVASGQVKRSWYWGPQANTGALQEDYAEGQGGKRLVQYFDKSRMEINNPSGNPNDPFFVTNGLLTVELISGKVQTGNATYANRYQADIPLASDPDDANAPTYLSFSGVSNTPLGDHPANNKVGQNATSTIARNGSVGDDATKASYPKVNIAYFEAATKHNIPLAIWEFLNETGMVYDTASAKTSEARLSDPWFYATGFPISEAYWARVKVAGQMQDVLIQAFERRVVTYTPNGVPGFKVQMGNIGQHYYDWRYKDIGRPQGGTGTPAPNTTPVATATRPATTPTTAPQPSPAADDCSGVPAGQNTTVSIVLPGENRAKAGNCGPGGTIFIFEARGFQPNETVSLYFTAPDQAVYEARRFDATAAGTLGIQFTTQRNFPSGIWALTMEGINSRAKAIGYFKILGAPPTPTRVPATPGSAPPCDTSASRNGEARPNSGRPGDTLQITARGFRPDEAVSYWFTYPDGEVFGTEEAVEGLVNSDGTIGPLPFEIYEEDAEYPGTWGLTFQGSQSANTAVIFFCINR